MKIYLASSWRNAHQPGVLELLREAGHVVYDFRHPDPSDPENHGFSWKQVDGELGIANPAAAAHPLVDAERWRRMVDHPIAQKGFALDFEAMVGADLCVLVLPAGRSASWECGYMMGSGKPAIIFAPEPTEPELMFREAEIVGDAGALLEAIDRRAHRLALERQPGPHGAPPLRRRVVYVAGPFRSRSHWGIVQNVRAAELVALKVWAYGAVAICPHLNTANFQGALPDDVWLDGTLALLKRCDALVLVDGWRSSVGTLAEINFARLHKIPIFESAEEVDHWLRGGTEPPKLEGAA